MIKAASFLYFFALTAKLCSDYERVFSSENKTFAASFRVSVVWPEIQPEPLPGVSPEVRHLQDREPEVPRLPEGVRRLDAAQDPRHDSHRRTGKSLQFLSFKGDEQQYRPPMVS